MMDEWRKNAQAAAVAFDALAKAMLPIAAIVNDHRLPIAQILRRDENRRRAQAYLDTRRTNRNRRR